MQRDFQRYADAQLPIWREAFAGLEWAALHCSPVYAGIGIPRGNGQAVVVVPGLLASDVSLMELFSWLKRTGYRPYYSRIGRNRECPDVAADKLCKTVEFARNETGRRVTIIGHSLGGLLARGVALRCPENVERVITMGSPVNGVSVHPAVILAGELAGAGCDGECAAPMQAPLAAHIAEYNIYTKRDGICGWRSCRRDDAATVEVPGTHIGMIVSPHVYRAIANVMAERHSISPRACRPARLARGRTVRVRTSHRRALDRAA